MVLLINYELKDTTKDYTSFFEAIKANCYQWWHFLEPTWIVATTLSADAFAKLLYPHMLNTDSLLVVQIGQNHQGWLKTEAWDWLNRQTY